MHERRWYARVRQTAIKIVVARQGTMRSEECAILENSILAGMTQEWAPFQCMRTENDRAPCVPNPFPALRFSRRRSLFPINLQPMHRRNIQTQPASGFWRDFLSGLLSFFYFDREIAGTRLRVISR